MIRLTRFLCFFLAVCLPFGSVAQSRRGEVTVAYQIQDGFCYASINRSGWREPKSVRICAEKELDSVFAVEGLSEKRGPHLFLTGRKTVSGQFGRLDG